MSGKITVGYWGIRGLAAPLRMMVMYRNVPLQAECYDVKETPTKDGFDRSSWLSVKEGLRAKNPLINLPYVIDGDLVISQSNACFMYLGRKLNLLGSNEVEHCYCEQLLCEVMDLRNNVVRFAYGRSMEAAPWLESIATKGSSLDKLNTWLERKYSSWTDNTNLFFVGNDATAPDFHIWEMCDQLRLTATFSKCPDPLAAYPALSQFHKAFAALPGNQRYMQSKLAQLPCNNLMAGFGATPGGAPWVWGSEQPWTGSSGTY